MVVEFCPNVQNMEKVELRSAWKVEDFGVERRKNQVAIREAYRSYQNSSKLHQRMRGGQRHA